MPAPIFAALLGVMGGALLVISAFLGVTPIADWTIVGAAACFMIAVIVFLGWFLAGCVDEIRKA
jgi:hypothetical protein